MAILLLFYARFAYAGGSPVVLSTQPVNGDRAVSNKLERICVTFDMKMRAGGWSWAYADKAKFPELNGQPRYDGDMKTNCLPVRLKPETEYEVWINSATHRNFQSEAGVPAVPYLLKFRTGR
jgi:hypothetical protein